MHKTMLAGRDEQEPCMSGREKQQSGGVPQRILTLFYTDRSEDVRSTEKHRAFKFVCVRLAAGSLTFLPGSARAG